MDQGVNDNKNIAKVGFIDNFEEKDVFITDLYERNLYNQLKFEKTGDINFMSPAKALLNIFNLFNFMLNQIQNCQPIHWPPITVLTCISGRFFH